MKECPRLLVECPGDDGGVATVEFALWMVFVFAVLLVGFDFGMYSIYQARLGRSVSEASNYAFANFAFEKTTALNGTAVESIRQYVTNASDLPGDPVNVIVTCNVDETCTEEEEDRKWACLESDGTIAAAASSDELCGTGATAGYYLTVRAEYTYAQQVVANPWLNGARMVQTSTVQLQ